VSNNGKVYQKDLGKDSTALGAKITTFDPGPGWKEVARKNAQGAGPGKGPDASLRTSRSIHDPRAKVLQQPLEFRRVHDDGAARGAQSIDGLGSSTNVVGCWFRYSSSFLSFSAENDTSIA
jgi:hypothetical protein